MKNLLRSLIGAAALHTVYFTGTLAVGYIKTRYHKPDMDAAWENAAALPSEVAFGYTFSPFLYAATFLGTALIIFSFISAYQKLVPAPRKGELYER